MTRTTSHADRMLLTAGGLAALLFCGVSTYEAMTRPGFDLGRHAISMLSLGERGWVMATTFVLSGLLVMLCAIGLRRTMAGGRAGTWGPILVGLYGVGLVLAGIFPAPSGLGFPPGTPDDQLPVMTTSAIVHSMGFMLAFSSLTAACFIFARRLSAGSSKFSLAAGIAMPLLVVLGMANVIAPGIAFYIAAIVGWAWLALVAFRVADVGSPAERAVFSSQV